MKESEYINEQLKGVSVMEKESSILKAAIDLVKASGYSVTRTDEEPHKSVLKETKEIVAEASTGIGHFVRGLGRVTLEKATAIGTTVKENAQTIAEKGK